MPLPCEEVYVFDAYSQLQQNWHLQSMFKLLAKWHSFFLIKGFVKNVVCLFSLFTFFVNEQGFSSDVIYQIWSYLVNDLTQETLSLYFYQSCHPPDTSGPVVSAVLALPASLTIDIEKLKVILLCWTES